MKHYLDLRLWCALFAFWSFSATAAFYPINRGMVNNPTYVTTSGGTTTAAATGNQIYIFEGSSAQTLKLPPATALPIDWWYDAINNSTGSVSVQDNSGGAIGTVGGGDIGRIFLKARPNVAGTWKINTNVSPNTLLSYYQKSDFIDHFTGAVAPVKTNGVGYVDATLIPTLNQDTNGNAATATALAASPTQCSSGFHAIGILRSGNANCVADGASTTGDVTLGTGLAFGSGTGVASVIQAFNISIAGGYYLPTTTDQTNWNAKQVAGNYITGITGDLVATGPGAVAGTLATVNASPGTTALSTVTTNAKGLVTANAAASTTGSGNVVLASSPTLVTPALGTPTALVGTNITGTASGLTCGNVTTNANLTGVITSVGNATSTGAQTGTGSTFVMSTAPAMTNPVVGTQSIGDSSTKAASTAFVQTALAQLNPAAAVTAASTANIAGTYTNAVGGVCIGDTFQVTATTAFAPDGITLTVGQRFLMKNQSSAFQNGVWTLTTAANVGVLGALLTRALDWDSSADINAGNLIPVISGTTNANTVWYQSAAVTTCSSDSQVYTQFSGSSGGATAIAVLTKTASYAVLTGDFSGFRLLLEVNAAAPATITLPAASNSGYELKVINIGSATVTVSTAGSDTFGSTSDTTWTLIPGGSPQSSNIFVSNGGSRWNGF